MAIQAMEQMNPSEAVSNGAEWEVLTEMEIEESEARESRPKHMRQEEMKETQPKHLRREQKETSNRRPRHLREPKHLREEEGEMGDFQPKHLRMPRHLRESGDEVEEARPQHLRKEESEGDDSRLKHLREEEKVVLDEEEPDVRIEDQLRQDPVSSVGEGTLVEDGVRGDDAKEAVLVDEEDAIEEMGVKTEGSEAADESAESELRKDTKREGELGGDGVLEDEIVEDEQAKADIEEGEQGKSTVEEGKKIEEQVEDEQIEDEPAEDESVVEDEPAEDEARGVVVEYRSRGDGGEQVVLSEGKKDEDGMLAMPDRMVVLDRAEVDKIMEEFTLIRGFIKERAAADARRVMGGATLRVTTDEMSAGFQKYAERFGRGGIEVNEGMIGELREEYVAEIKEETRRESEKRASRGMEVTEEAREQEAKKEEMREIARARESLQRYAEGKGINLDFKMAGELIDGFTPEMKEKESGKKKENRVETARELDTQGRADFIKYAEAHGIKSAAEMRGWSQDRLQAFRQDFEAWRRLRSERMQALRGYDYYIRNSEDTIARIRNERAHKAQEEMQEVEDHLKRVQRSHAETEQQQAHIDVATDRLQRRLGRAKAKYEREDARRGEGLTSEQEARIEHEKGNIRRFREANRLVNAERMALETGADSERVRYSVEQKRVMDESALLTKMSQEYRAIPAWKIGERRKMKKRIEEQRKIVDQAVEFLTEAQRGRSKEKSWMKGETKPKGGETQDA